MSRMLSRAGKTLQPGLDIARLPARLPQIALRHGQVLWLLKELGYGDAVSEGTFREYVKSLRKLGIPFGRKKFATKLGRKLANYSYCHVMELALTLSLRVYHVVPDSVLKKIVQYRPQLHGLYKRAYAERHSGAWSAVVMLEKRKRIEARGLFLCLDIEFSGGRLVHFGQPKLVSFAEAVAILSENTLFGRTLLPGNLSQLAESVVALALRAPMIRSGPQRRLRFRPERNHRGVGE